MYLTVIGIEHSKGNYNGADYDNYKFHCIRPSDALKDESGSISEVIKIKASDVSSFPQINDEIRPMYDRYGRVIDIVIKD